MLSWRKCARVSMTRVKQFLKSPKVLRGCAWGLIGLILLWWGEHAFAAGRDVLSGTTSDATTTIGQSGKRWLYLIEGVASLFAYIKTKNVFVLGGLAVVAIMVNIILHLAGGA